MLSSQTLEQQLITKFAQELLTFLRYRPGVALESLSHSTPEMSFDLGKAREKQVIHNRAGDRIFITNVTGIAYIRFNSATGSKYQLRVGKIATPFRKLYLENAAQIGKSVSIIIGYGAFVDFVASNRDVLTTIAGKDFATQVTLALIKAKTDLLTKLDVNLSTVATQATLALMKTKIDNTYTEVQKLSTPVSDHDTSTGAALTVSLEVGHRRFVEIWMKTSAAATFKIYGSKDNTNWRECDEIEFDGAGELKNGYFNSDKYVKVSTTDANNNEIEITAS